MPLNCTVNNGEDDKLFYCAHFSTIFFNHQRKGRKDSCWYSKKRKRKHSSLLLSQKRNPVLQMHFEEAEWGNSRQLCVLSNGKKWKSRGCEFCRTILGRDPGHLRADGELDLDSKEWPRDSVSLRNTPSISELWGITLTHTFSNSLTYQTIPHPSSTLNKHLGILVLITVRKQLTNELTSRPSGDIGAAYNVCSHQTRNSEWCALQIHDDGQFLRTAQHVPGGPCGGLSGAAGWRWSRGKPEKASPPTRPVETSSTLVGSSYYFLRRKR